MIPKEQLNILTKKILSQFGFDNDCDNDNNNDNVKKRFISLTPAQIMVVSGILTNVLSIESLTVDREQQIQILLSGSLKRKTELEKTLDKIGEKPFDEVLQALLNRY